MLPDWQHRRNGFNHDWLKNRFLTAMSSFVNILDDLVEDPETELRFVRDLLPQWPGRAAEAAGLIAAFKTEMSPTILFRQPPLYRCGPATMEWLPGLVHLLWCQRLSVNRMCTDACRAIAVANDSYEHIAKALVECASPVSVETLRPYRDLFSEFRAACEEVSLSISSFPNRIEVV